MKMSFLSGGRLRMKKRIYVPDAEREELIDLPVISTLFRHPEATVLFDTGCHPLSATDPEARWGGLAKVMTPIAPPKSDVISSLARHGLGPDDIDIVVNSHLHPDHCGCNEFFRRATFVIHEAELAVARADGAEAKGYLRQEWEHPMPVTPVADSHDVLGDGRLVTQALPGHTPGSMGLRAGLDRSGDYFLVADAVALRRNLDRDEAPRNSWDTDLLRRSYEVIRAAEEAGATIICGHDDEQWQELAKGPAIYE